MSDNDIVSDFLAESHENLDRLDRELVGLEKNPEDGEVLAGVFRTIHTIKGTCGFLGFNKLEKIAHAGENLLALLRDGRLKLTPEITTALLSMVDAIRTMLAEIQSSGQDGETEYPTLMETLKRLQKAAPGSKAAAAGTEAGSLGQPQNPAAFADAAGSGNGKTNTASEPQARAVAVPETTPGDEANAAAAEPCAPAAKADGPPAAGAAPLETIRVGVNLLDKLMTLVGELVLARNQLLQFSNTVEDASLQGISQRMNLIATELQEEVMKTRLQPIGNIWNQFPRTVRDVALGCGKEVRIEMEGQETELDKTIIEAMKDPLTHLVRNSVDHGIELPEERAKAGKERIGRLTLRAFHEGGQVNIEIGDDGAGLSAERIRQKALERGLVTAEQEPRLSDREIHKLIFLPGFSTARKVTNVSGRGVGMDVVKTNVEKIGGTVDVQSKAGQGTTVRIKIPLTLAIIPALVVTCAKERFAIPQVSLLELVRLAGKAARSGIEMVHGAPVYRLRGRLLPIVNLRQELKIGATNRSGGNETGESGAAIDKIDFELARAKHLLWKSRIRDFLDGKSTLTEKQAGSHKECALGKWIYGGGLEEYGDLGEMRELERTHEELHATVREIIAHKSRGDVTASEDGFLKIGSLSERIVSLLNAVERRVEEHKAVNIVVLQAGERPFGLVVDEINDTQEIVVKPLRKQLKSIKTFAGASIMGDGKIALILDVMGVAHRSGVISEARDRALAEKAAAMAEKRAEKQTFLLFAGPDDARMAVPIGALDRLEEFPTSQVEHSGVQWVAQYRGRILPLIHLRHALQERRRARRAADAGAETKGDAYSILVCHCEGESVGIVVERILDIVEDAAELRYPASRAGVLYSAVINGRVTELLDIPALMRAGGVVRGEPAAREHPAEMVH
jgi:chemotaxis protein histidine kinase CheA